MVDVWILHKFWTLFILIPRDIFSLLVATFAAFLFFISTSGITIIGRLCANLFSLGVKKFVIICCTRLLVLCLALLAGFFAALIVRHGFYGFTCFFLLPVVFVGPIYISTSSWVCLPFLIWVYRSGLYISVYFEVLRLLNCTLYGLFISLGCTFLRTLASRLN